MGERAPLYLVLVLMSPHHHQPRPAPRAPLPQVLGKRRGRTLTKRTILKAYKPRPVSPTEDGAAPLPDVRQADGLPVYSVGDIPVAALRALLDHLGAEPGGSCQLAVTDVREELVVYVNGASCGPLYVCCWESLTAIPGCKRVAVIRRPLFMLWVLTSAFECHGMCLHDVPHKLSVLLHWSRPSSSLPNPIQINAQR